MPQIHEGSLIQRCSATALREFASDAAKSADLPSSDFSNAIDKMVSSLCPVCLNVIKAHLFEKGGKVLIEKECDVHGYFLDIYWSDVSLYKRFIKYFNDDRKLSKLATDQKGCPLDCGICDNHITGTLLGNIDLTNRCNMTCPICFANAGTNCRDPEISEILAMMKNLRAEKPVPCQAIQFSGGEPTIRNDLSQIIEQAKKLGFSQIQIATNGLRFAESLPFCRLIQQSGLNTAYLQFDGVTPEPYIFNRGRNVLPMKLKALDNLRKAGLESVVLVPTLSKGINDHQVGDIVRFASKNLDIVRGVNFQPVSFTGRIDSEERVKKRITIPDFIALLEEQMDNEITWDDFYPIPFIIPISQLVAAQSDKIQPMFTVHPCCGAATYVYRSNGHLIPLTRFIDVEGLMERIKMEVENFNGSSFSKLRMSGMILKELPKFVDEDLAPGDINITKMLISIFRNGTRDSLREFHKKTLFVGTMHFQDAYNIDLERLQRCGIHYALPDGKIIPFCAYNIIYR